MGEPLTYNYARDVPIEVDDTMTEDDLTRRVTEVFGLHVG
jgi:hypothetical protein